MATSTWLVRTSWRLLRLLEAPPGALFPRRDAAGRAGAGGLVSAAGDVRRVRLSNPERHNAFDDGLVSDLHEAFREVSEDETIRAVVLASEGSRD